ncbi:HMG box-containing protein 4 [Lucilia cuprina]|uniref:HMG box-containing protein 4 n=1 Tax=Lucilia cuprina TaxID=7375 RepID=UPI001F052FCE|nr:HMG box-containing protein 4 [Lucilia cuprina]
METPHSTTNTKEFEVTGVSRSGRVRKKSSKLLDFQSPDEVERKIYKRTTASSHNTPRSSGAKYAGRGRPSLAALKARRAARVAGADEENDVAADDEGPAAEEDVKDKEEVMDVEQSLKETADEDEEDEEEEDEEDINDVLHNTSGLTAATDSDDDGFGELVADLVGSEAANLDGPAGNQKSPFRQSLYMTEKNKKLKENRVERKDKGKTRYTAYNMWAREHRKSNKFGKTSDIDHQAARRLHELWSNVSNKEKNAWKRKAKMQATRAKQRERAGITQTNKTAIQTAAQAANPQNSTFINRPTTSRTKKLAEDKQKAKDDMLVAKPNTIQTSTPKRTRNNSYRRNQTNTPSSATNGNDNNTSSLYIATNGSTNNYNNKSLTLNNSKTPLPNIEPIDAAAHLKLLGESLSIIGDRLKEHEGQIAVSGSLSVLLDSLLCSLGPLLCLTTRLPGLDKKPQLKANLATTLDNIAYVMPGL